jgi:acyl-CoA synthetase (AMP-forming)/AMP-acid ligase II
MIITGAENVYPIEVEQVIATLDGVTETAVIGVPDAVSGEAVTAYVVQRPDAGLDAAAIIDHCRRNIAGYKVPRHVIFTEELPRTTVNKISKAALREWFSGSRTASRP